MSSATQAKEGLDGTPCSAKGVVFEVTYGQSWAYNFVASIRYFLRWGLGGLFDWVNLFRTESVHGVDKKPIFIPGFAQDKWEFLRADFETMRVAPFNLQFSRLVCYWRRVESNPIGEDGREIPLEEIKFRVVNSHAGFHYVDGPEARIRESDVDGKVTVKVFNICGDVPQGKGSNLEPATIPPGIKHPERESCDSEDNGCAGHNFQPNV